MSTSQILMFFTSPAQLYTCYCSDVLITEIHLNKNQDTCTEVSKRPNKLWDQRENALFQVFLLLTLENNPTFFSNKVKIKFFFRFWLETNCSLK